MIRSIVASSLLLLAATACSDTAANGDDTGTPDASGTGVDSPITPPGAISVIVIPLENKDSVDVYNNMTDAPYINSLLATSAYATMFKDELTLGIPSEPHYVWMEAGTNVFSDRTFTNDNDASATNSTASTEHLSTQLDAAGISWKAYQEGMTMGTCPISSTGHYAAKHDPFVFFKDVSGTTPSVQNQACAGHHATFTQLTSDLAANNLPRYSFITPNLCNDMHGAFNCPSGITDAANVKAGDDWLKANLPPILQYAHSHNAVVMLVWDEGNSSSLMPFVMIGDHVVPGPNTTVYNHSSQLATVERLLGVPKLATVASATDFSAMFQPGFLP